MQNNFSLMALSAPHWVKKATSESLSLNTKTPFSLQNAVRLATSKAMNGEGHLGTSNWSSKENLRDTVFMMQYWEDEKEMLKNKLLEIKPNVLFIGAMTLSFPGSIEVAKLAKDVLGDDVFIVLGGKHANETFYEDCELGISNHNGSPIKLMEENKIPKVFDLVCSGYCEELIAEVAEKIGNLISEGKKTKEIYKEMPALTETANGNWRVGWITDNKRHEYQSEGKPIDYSEMPVPAELFGIKESFQVYETELTAHASSDTSHGCIFNCSFCSESAKINGQLQDKNHSAARLFRQLKKIKETALAENYTESISAFVEDSTLLNIYKDPSQMYELARLLKEDGLKIKFGGQFTVDELLDPKIQQALKELKEVGLSYIFTGMETGDEKVAQKMSKNKDQQELSWIEKNEKAIIVLRDLGIKYGISVLIGLGENSETRSHQLDLLREWQKKYQSPSVVSMNLATKHPLQNKDIDENFIEWGTPADSQYLEIFQNIFWEASERYALDKKNFPSIEELREIRQRYIELDLDQELRNELKPNFEIKWSKLTIPKNLKN